MHIAFIPYSHITIGHVNIKTKSVEEYKSSIEGEEKKRKEIAMRGEAEAPCVRAAAMRCNAERVQEGYMNDAINRGSR